MILFSFTMASNQPVYHVPIQGTIDMGLPHYLQRVIDQAESEEAAAIIFDIDTFGGRVDAATQMKDLILDSKVTTVAFINKRAISAGALISFSCDSIFMTAGASIGAATAVDLQGEKASEKVISYMREEMASTAEANNRPRDVASAMVDEELSIPFVVNSQGDTLTSKNVEGFAEGKLITLSTNLAILLDIADKQLNNIDDVLDHMNLGDAKKVEIKESWSEMLVRFLTNPTVAPLFMSLGMLGLFFEIKSPGFGVPGILGLTCLALFFGSHLLVGLADMTEFIILFSGIILILLEILVIPGFGVAGISGIILCFYAFFKMLIGVYPSPGDYEAAYFGLSIGIITAVIAAVILYKTLPQTSLYKKLIPFTPQKSEEGFTISRGFETLIGETGKTTTDLRPSGKVEIHGKTYQALSHGDYIDKDKEIQVDSVDENQLLVKKV
jgi:membrane-bound serine protease (ClpP class)